MKIHYLGTGAAGGTPFPICSCRVCETARKNGGKEIRSRAGFLINDDILIDFSCDFFHHVVTQKIDFRRISTILVTHTHCDHFYPYDIGEVERYVRRNPTAGLKIYGNEKVKAILDDVPFETTKYTHIPVHVMRTGETVRVNEYTVTAIKTEHIPNENSLMYVITQGGKSYLHSGDSAVFSEETYAVLKKLNVRFDAVTLECTFGDMEKGYWGHMTLWENVAIRNRLKELGMADDNTKFVATHIADCCGKTFYELEEVMKKEGFILSYDGMILEL